MWHLYGVFYQIAVRVPGAVWLKRLLVGRPRPEFWFLSCILRTAAYPVCLSGLRQEDRNAFSPDTSDSALAANLMARLLSYQRRGILNRPDWRQFLPEEGTPVLHGLPCNGRYHPVAVVSYVKFGKIPVPCRLRHV
jgi:hypothetical protein